MLSTVVVFFFYNVDIYFPSLYKSVSLYIYIRDGVWRARAFENKTPCPGPRSAVRLLNFSRARVRILGSGSSPRFRPRPPTPAAAPPQPPLMPPFPVVYSSVVVV